MQNQEKIIQAIAAYLENADWNWRLAASTSAEKIAADIAAVIAPHLQVGAGWEDAPSWAKWRLDYSDGSHNFSKGYPSIVTTGVVRIEARPK